MSSSRTWGFLIATYSWNGTTRLWDGATGAAVVLAPGKTFSEFSPDDDRLAFTRGAGIIGVWDVSTAPERRTLHAGMTGNRAERQVDGGVCRPSSVPTPVSWRPPRTMASGSGTLIRAASSAT